jgi:hypothetical protein
VLPLLPVAAAVTEPMARKAIQASEAWQVSLDLLVLPVQTVLLVLPAPRVLLVLLVLPVQTVLTALLALPVRPDRPVLPVLPVPLEQPALMAAEFSASSLSS